MQAPLEVRGVGFPCTGVTGGCEFPSVAPLGEQEVVLTSELVIYPQ